jgi:DnaJ family protein C protein 17
VPCPDLGNCSRKQNEFKWFKTVAWATGKEPDLSGLTELDPPSNISPQPASPSPVDTNSSYQSKPTSKAAPWVPPTPRQATSNDRPKKTLSFPSFTSKTASKPENPLFSKSTIAQSPDYESITLMRMRDAEMRRLETEIRNLDSTSADG